MTVSGAGTRRLDYHVEAHERESVRQQIDVVASQAKELVEASHSPQKIRIFGAREGLRLVVADDVRHDRPLQLTAGLERGARGG